MSEEKAIVISGDSVREGHVVEVYNKNRPKFSNAKKKYYVIWIQKDGVEFPIMLSDIELANLKKRADKNPEDVPKKSVLNNLTD